MQVESQAPSFEEMNKVLSETQYALNLKDRYVGDIDPVTKLRNGKGTYTYPNPFFQY